MYIFYSILTCLIISMTATAEPLEVIPSGSAVTAAIGGTAAKSCENNCVNRSELNLRINWLLASYTSTQISKRISQDPLKKRALKYETVNLGTEITLTGFEWVSLKVSAGPYLRTLQNSDQENDQFETPSSGVSLMSAVGVHTIGFPVMLGFELQLLKYFKEDPLFSYEMIYVGYLF